LRVLAGVCAPVGMRAARAGFFPAGFVAVVAFYRAAGGADVMQHGQGVQVVGQDARAGGDGALFEAVAEKTQGEGLHEGQGLTRVGYDGGRHREEFLLFLAARAYGCWLSCSGRW
jgi:hypothetical protein